MKIPVLIPNIFNHPFTYSSDSNLNVGDYVVVPFGKSKITGIVWDHFEKNNNKKFQIKKIIKKINVKPLKNNTIRFLNWFSEYNLVPRGMALKLHLLSNEAIEDQKNVDYEKFQIISKKKKIYSFQRTKNSFK